MELVLILVESKKNKKIQEDFFFHSKSLTDREKIVQGKEWKPSNWTDRRPGQLDLNFDNSK